MKTLSLETHSLRCNRERVRPENSRLLFVIGGSLDSELPRLAFPMRPEHEKALRPVALKRLMNAFTLEPALVRILQQLAIARETGVRNNENIGAGFGRRRRHLFKQPRHTLTIEGPNLVKDRESLPASRLPFVV